MAPRLKKEARRKQLLKSAMVAFGRKGYHNTQVSDIIKQAGVARGTFYLYYKSKKEIFNAVVTHILQKIMHEIKTVPREAFDQIPSQILGNIERITTLLLSNPLFLKIVLTGDVGFDKSFDQRLRQFYEEILDYIRRALRQGQEMGFVRQGKIRTLAVCLLGCIKEIFFQTALGTEKPSVSEAVEEIYQLVLHGVGKPELISQITQPHGAN